MKIAGGSIAAAFILSGYLSIGGFSFFKTETPVPAGISASELAIRDKLIKDFSKSLDEAKLRRIFYDSKLILDESVAGLGKGDGGFDYFSPRYGLLEEGSLNLGLDYFKKNKKHFEAAAKTYGVEPEVLLGILKVETEFGNYLGKRPVINSLYSIYVLSPGRRSWAANELEYFLKLAERHKWDVFSVSGSIAGAFGLPQFIPSSFWHFAVDGNGDGVINLFDDADAILSAANYLSEHGFGKSHASKHRAVFAYNHSNQYVRAVLRYADAIKRKMPPK